MPKRIIRRRASQKEGVEKPRRRRTELDEVHNDLGFNAR
jgi:hypothetical protein